MYPSLAAHIARPPRRFRLSGRYLAVHTARATVEIARALVGLEGATLAQTNAINVLIDLLPKDRALAWRLQRGKR